MPKRKKRLERGIESLGKQKIIHEKKKELAEKLGNEELYKYYDKEIEKFEKEKTKKEERLK